MPAIFPELQPEELLYSGIARYGDMMGFQSALALWRSVYGEGLPYPEVDLCGPLKSLLSRMPKEFSHDAASLLRKHTLFPYHTFSMLPKRRGQIEEKLSSDGSRPKGGLLRTGAWPVKPPTYLQYCQACAETDRGGSTGIRFWRRSHQLPGVVVCPEHGERLMATEVLRPKTPYSREIVSLEQSLRQGKGHELRVPSEMIGAARRVAKDSLWLLQNTDLGNGDLLRRHKSWQSRRGWQYRKGRNVGKIKTSALCKAVKKFYADDFLQTLCEGDEALTISKNGGWIRSMSTLSREHVARSPLKHILLWQFLGITAREFFAKQPEVVASNKETSKYSIENKNITKERLMYCRKKWLNIAKEFPNDGRMELRERCKHIDSYLSKYDKGWYSKNSPKKILEEGHSQKKEV